MVSRPSTIERAFELARAGYGMADIKRHLKTEGYADAEGQLFGSSVAAGLKRARMECVIHKD